MSDPLVDVHHHWMPAEHFHGAERWLRPNEEARRTDGVLDIYRDGQRVFPNMREILYRIDDQLATMDRVGVRTAVLCTANWMEWTTMANCRTVNDGLAEVVRRYPDRFVGLAHVPPVEDGALDELKRCVQELGFRGVAVGAYLVPEQLQLDAPELRPFWRQVDALDVPVVVHPSTLPQEWAMLRDYDLTRSVGRAYNVTVATMRLLMSGLLDELPRLRFVMPHLGGTFYALGDRYLGSYFDFGTPEVERERERLRKARERLYFDTAPPHWPVASLRHAVEQLGPEHVLFGSDYPIQESFLERAVRLFEAADFDAPVRQQVGWQNAQRLFGLG